MDPLLLSDFIVPAGRVAVFAALIELEVSGEGIYRPSIDIGSLIDGDLILASDITIDRWRVRSGPRVQFNRAGAGSVRDYLGANEDGIFHFQDADGVDTEAVSAIAAADRLTGGANLRGADLVSRVDALVTGDRLIVAFTLPSVTTVDHAVDAGGVSWGFDLPQPSVTHTPASGAVDHAVDAGAAAWSFDLPEPSVTHTPATPAGVVSVTVPLTGVSVFTNYIRWSDNQSLGSLFSADGGDQTLTTVDLNSGSPSGQVFISIIGTDNRFTPAFESSGTIIFEASDGETLEVMIADADMSEPYMWVPLASLFEVVAFVNHIRTLTDQTGTLTLRGEGTPVTVDHAVDAGGVEWAFLLPQPTVTHTPAATTDHAVDAGAAAWSFDLPQPTVTHTPAVTTDHAVDAGPVAWSFALPQPTVTHTAAPTDQLVLSDSDDTGLEVVAKALLVASAAATVAGNIFYEDADRGGTDAPLDGELGLGADNTRISRFRRVSDAVVVLNDNDSPAAFDIGAYFNTGGDGNDLTLYFQTLSGEVSFSCQQTQLLSQGGRFRTVHATGGRADVARWDCER